jgi:hypothetical protein
MVKIFVAYARKDTRLLDKFRSHLSSLEHINEVRIWYDGKIIPSTVWEDQIREQMHQADIILMLLSPDAIASEYFYHKELTDAMERHLRGDAHVVPVILRPCVWEPTPLGRLQVVPRNGKPVTLWVNRDEAYLDAVKSIQQIVSKVKDKKQKLPIVVSETRDPIISKSAGLQLGYGSSNIDQNADSLNPLEIPSDTNLDGVGTSTKENIPEIPSSGDAVSDYPQPAFENDSKPIKPETNHQDSEILSEQDKSQVADFSSDTDVGNFSPPIISPQIEDQSRKEISIDFNKGTTNPLKIIFFYISAFTVGLMGAIYIYSIYLENKTKENLYESSWKKANEENTILALQSFIDSFPDCNRRDSVAMRIISLNERVKKLIESAEILGKLQGESRDSACSYLRQAITYKPNVTDTQKIKAMQNRFRCRVVR